MKSGTLFPARFESFCRRCTWPILIGELIGFVSSGVHCAECWQVTDD